MNEAITGGSEKENIENYFTVINTNARSLTPKLTSFIDCMGELDASIAVITETWLADGPTLAGDLDDLLQGKGIGMITKNRKPSSNGVAHGGVAIAFRASTVRLQEIKVSNPESYEVIVAAGSIAGQPRKLIVIAAYLPPGYVQA